MLQSSGGTPAPGLPLGLCAPGVRWAAGTAGAGPRWRLKGTAQPGAPSLPRRTTAQPLGRGALLAPGPRAPLLPWPPRSCLRRSSDIAVYPTNTEVNQVKWQFCMSEFTLKMYSF